MKTKAILLEIIAVTLLTLAGTAFAAKPANNLAGAQKYGWHLSAAVMPVPPYGSLDIPGSDTASKLIVNQPNGKVQAMATGVMNGLHPNTEYTVYLSNAWTTSEKLSIVGDWTLSFMYGGSYNHEMTVTSQNMLTGAFSGYGHYISDPSYTWNIQGTSSVIGDTITLDLIYTGSNPGYTVHATGTIAADGTMSGDWTSSAGQSGTWSSTTGNAVKVTSGNGWPGLFTSTVQPFTFTTDDTGSGSWHVNLRANDFLTSGLNKLSVWINEAGGTMLISDVFTVTV